MTESSKLKLPERLPGCKGYVAIVGSREASLDELELMIRLGRTYTDHGYGVSSGDAFGSDKAGWWGAKQSRRYNEVGARIYLVDSWRNRKRCEENDFFYIANDFTENWIAAESIACSARGGWGGIEGPQKQFSRDLHTRNVFQIMGHTLNDPVMTVILSATPKRNDTVSGGTNTAYQVAKKCGVETIINLATPEGFKWAEDFLKGHELDYPYVEIDWRQILKPDDPRLEHLT